MSARRAGQRRKRGDGCIAERMGKLKSTRIDVGEVKGRDCEKEEDSKKEKEQEREVA